MTMTIKIQDLVPQSSKLAQSIAHELEIKYDQVQMLNFTSEGNGSLIRWAISPDGPNDYIPNTTAESILSRLNEGSVHLPDTFGTYKLVSWKVEPPPKR
ncbi:hypothetical protein AMTR_s00001p00273130 [Amborella trichopoda]|uniref:Uncharacterized protein n=2 Tax=Amborella trichopoda TaxID=13333 RepID=W1NN48_AMBTC|nr:hypothetical protein AMTR_s00001p00273130 [Amborella trichopoda]